MEIYIFSAILATVKKYYEDNSYWNYNTQIIGEVSKLYTVQESCISWVYMETLRVCCSWDLQLEDFWASKKASLGMEEDILLFKRWLGHLYWIINFIKEKKNKQFLFFISKWGAEPLLCSGFAIWHLIATAWPQQGHRTTLTLAIVFSHSQNFWRFWKQTWTVFINK